MATLAVSLAVRTLHVLAMAVLLGGGLHATLVLTRKREGWLAVARAYEWLFWGAAGILVMTGIGNLGAFGGGLPGARTRWGTVLTVKVALVVALLSLGLLRTVVLHVAGERATPPRALVAIHVFGVAAALAIVVLAEVLSHG